MHADPAGPQPKLGEDLRPHRTAEAIRELLECAIQLQFVEGSGQYREHLARLHRQERHPADDSSRGRDVEQLDLEKPRRVHPERSRARVKELQRDREFRPVLDEGEFVGTLANLPPASVYRLTRTNGVPPASRLRHVS